VHFIDDLVLRIGEGCEVCVTGCGGPGPGSGVGLRGCVKTCFVSWCGDGGWGTNCSFDEDILAYCASRSHPVNAGLHGIWHAF
jgi:hypothetical protein